MSYKLYTLTKITKPSAVLSSFKYAIMVFSQKSVYIPGDERSRSAPGHGYPEHTETFNTNDLYMTNVEQDWKDAIAELYTQKPGRTDVLAWTIESVAKVEMKTTITVAK